MIYIYTQPVYIITQRTYICIICTDTSYNIFYSITHVMNTKSICCGATWSAFEGGHWWPLWPESEALRALQRAAQDGGIGLGLVSNFFWTLLA